MIQHAMKCESYANVPYQIPDFVLTYPAVAIVLPVPSIAKIVYSTCSVHSEENEHVVHRALASPEVTGSFRLAPRSMVLPEWLRRGLSDVAAGSELGTLPVS